jgi:hypothetical protein
MRRSLANDRLRKNAPVVRDQRRRAVITTALEAEYQCHFASGPLP